MIRSKRANLRRGAGTGVPADRRNRRAATRARVSGAEPVRGSAARAAGETLAAASDDHLLHLAARSEQAAWAALVRRHLPALVSYAWYLLHDRSEAEDVVQDAFLRLLAKAPTWQPDGANLRTWLHRVVTNLCIDRKRRLVRLIYLPACLLDGGSAGPALEDEIGRRHAVVNALRRLPRRQRAALVLVHYQGFSNPEAAAVMGTTTESVEALLARARRRLRELLAPHVQDLLETSS